MLVQYLSSIKDNALSCILFILSKLIENHKEKNHLQIHE